MKPGKYSSLGLLCGLAIVLLSFYSPFGGEGYEIYVDNKMVMQQFGKEMKQLKNLQLNASNSNSELSVKFYHCGMAGKSRSLQLKTPGQEILKQWQFANSGEKNFAIKVPVKEIIDLQKRSGAGTLHLYYASKEAPQGRFLAGIVLENNLAAN